MSHVEIRQKIEDFRDLGFAPYIKRAGTLMQAEYMVSTVIGVRRSGKSFRVMQAADELLSTGEIASMRHICHLDFDNPILAKMSIEQLSSIPEIFLSITPEATLETSILFIFDELHTIAGWELFVVELSRNPHWKVIVTGSSSKMLRHDIATQLRGKAIPTEIYPLSFNEFLAFKNIEVRFSTQGSAAMRGAFNEFLKWGSFPAISRVAGHLKEPILREYFDTMVLKDIVQRYNISKPRFCIELYYYLLSCIGRPITTVSAHAFLKEAGESVSRDAVAEWIGWARDSWLFFTVPVFSDSLKAQERNYKKLYAIDWALAHVNSRTWDGSLSHSLENMVYIHLRRSFPRVNYYLTREKRREIDFIVCDSGGKPVKLIQVCLDISDPATRERECAPLVSAARYFGVDDLLIVTMDTKETISVGGVNIRMVPVWLWLLEKC